MDGRRLPVPWLHADGERRHDLLLCKGLQRKKFEVNNSSSDRLPGKNDGDAADMMLQYAHILKNSTRNGYRQPGSDRTSFVRLTAWSSVYRQHVNLAEDRRPGSVIKNDLSFTNKSQPVINSQQTILLSLLLTLCLLQVKQWTP